MSRESAVTQTYAKASAPCAFPDALRLVLLGLRHGLGWSQTDVAERMGVPRTNVSRWETSRELTVDALVRYAAAFDVPAGCLLAIACDLRERAA